MPTAICCASIGRSTSTAWSVPTRKRRARVTSSTAVPDGENVDDVIEGEIGRGNDEVGTPWEAIKQRNVKPDLDAIGGAGSGEVGGGDWDSDNSEPGEVEPPTEPDVDAPDL